MEAHVLTGGARAQVSSRAGGGRVNGSEPWSIDALGQPTLPFGTSRELGLSPSWEAALDDVPYILRSHGTIDLGNRELLLPG
jgi:hypothetical protein